MLPGTGTVAVKGRIPSRADTLIGYRLFTANDPDSTGIARSAPDLETLTLVAVQRH
jgi:hypothetical protein